MMCRSEVDENNLNEHTEGCSTLTNGFKNLLTH